MTTNPKNPKSSHTGSQPSPSVVDRRLGLDSAGVPGHENRGRRATDLNASVGKTSPAAADTGLERRRGPGRRRSNFTRSAEEGEMTQEQFLFLMAIDAFKNANGRAFPTWTDVLEVIRLLGYRKTMASELRLRNAEDWTEHANADAGVRPDHWEERAEQDRQKKLRLRRDDDTQAIGQAIGANDDQDDDAGPFNLSDEDWDLLSDAA